MGEPLNNPWATTANPNCDGAGPHILGPVKRFPIGDNAAMILCRLCWNRERLSRDSGIEWVFADEYTGK